MDYGIGGNLSAQEKWMSLEKLDLDGEQIVCPYCEARGGNAKPSYTGASLYHCPNDSEFCAAQNLSTNGDCSPATSSTYFLNTEEGVFLYQACTRCRAEWLVNPYKAYEE